ncbi:PHD finger protein 7-like isoform X2 [Adelges cooleyi]|uniref:PHD finger protein 7-like isoform X2 n=1 Tax=Adelges cooleyi TaxID=133065 RepID=UPI00217F870B|nr:PHD finger protein 7-like isoform X2 [Adelges cooleyi]
MPPLRRRSSRPLVRRQSARQPMPKDQMVELGLRHGKACMFCGRKEISEKLYGFLYQLNDIVVHYFCILLSSRAVQRGRDNDGIWGFLAKDIRSELERGSKVVCIYCKKEGATISCCAPKCRKVFHLPCGIENGSMHQFYQTFKSFCSQHRITQTVELQELQDSVNVQCAICKDEVKATPMPTSLWAPCCKRNAWFHRKCIQDLALSAGYFFKCPLCNNVETFKARMLTLGIYIPSRKLRSNCDATNKKNYNKDSRYLKKYNHRDASWERVPNAYAELLERHSECDAENCLCPHPQKRKFQQDSGPWEIKLCYSCGSSGTHLLCGQIKLCEERWYCGQCQTITGGPVDRKRRRLNDSVVSTNSNASTAQCDDVTPTKELKKPCSATVQSNSNVTENINGNASQSNETLALTQQGEDAIIVLDSSDSDDDDVKGWPNRIRVVLSMYFKRFLNFLVAYVDPPKIAIHPPSSQLPIISGYKSMSSTPGFNGFENRYSSSGDLKTYNYVVTESIDLTLDDDD